MSFTIRRGETLGLVGESGCGKTTVGRVLLRLIAPTGGTIRFDGTDITKLSERDLKPYRRRMQIIFQDPYASLDPRTPIGSSIGEGLRIHGMGTAAERRDKVAKIMELVGLQPYHARRYPHEFSGGQRQRIGIARALVARARSARLRRAGQRARRVSIQAQVLNLLAQPAARARPHVPLRRPQHGRRRAHQRPGGGDVPRHDGGDRRRRPTSIASRCTRTRSRSSRRCRWRTRRSARSRSGSSCSATSRRPSTRRPAARSTPAAGCASSSATRSAAPPSGRRCASSAPGHGVSCHFAEHLADPARRTQLISDAAATSSARNVAEDEEVGPGAPPAEPSAVSPGMPSPGEDRADSMLDRR